MARSLFLAGVLGAALLVAPAAHAAGPALTASVVPASTWNSGYSADVTIHNTGDAAVTGWVVEFDLPTGTTVTSSWSATRTASGNHYRFAALSWNGTVAPGGTASFGFNAANLGLPQNCLVNGSPCATVGSPPTSPPPTSPPPTTSPPTLPPSTGPTIDVSTAAQLSAALASVQPGQTIRLAAGTYSGAFLGQTAGTATAPITLTGPATAVLTNPGASGTNPGCSTPAAGFNPGYGLWLYGAAYWRLSGFTVANSAKGIVLDAAPHALIDGVDVHDIGDEGIHFRRSSADGVIENSRIERTGEVQPEYGEGIYLGSANSNWSCYGNTGGLDASERIQVLNNHIGPDVAAEHVDVKEGTTGGILRGNTFNGQGIAGQNSADSWVDVKGSDYLIQGNTGTFTAPGVFANGYETHNPTAGSGCGNTWRDNVSDLGNVGNWAIDVTSTSKCAGHLNVVYTSNTVTNALSGLTNINPTAG
jgi:hypothetical protein